MGPVHRARPGPAADLLQPPGGLAGLRGGHAGRRLRGRTATAIGTGRSGRRCARSTGSASSGTSSRARRRSGRSDHQPHSFAAIDGALAAHGSDVVDTYFDTVELMVGGAFALPGLADLAPTPTATVATGATNAVLPAQTLTVDHLAARYVKFVSGDSAGLSASRGDARPCRSTCPRASRRGRCGLVAAPCAASR